MKNMNTKKQEGDISLIERDSGKMPFGVFPEIQESFTDLAAGRIRKPCSEEVNYLTTKVVGLKKQVD